MKVAIFGGSGFMGYDFFRLLEGNDRYEPVIYTSGPKSLSNLARHDVDIRFVPSDQLSGATLDDDISHIVNFSHPFEKRQQMTPPEQVEALADFFGRARARNPKLVLVHISTMSVYEPFGSNKFFAEDATLAPPSEDAYASSKLLFEERLKALPNASDWQLMLRPTIVYGPFCRPWTDGPLKAFHEGDVEFKSLDGLIQPIWATDVSRFIEERLRDFQPGIFNMGGRETISWKAFFETFERIADYGRLVPSAVEEEPEEGAEGSTVRLAPGTLPWYAVNTRLFLRDVVKNKRLKEMIQPVRANSPDWLIRGVRSALQTGEKKPIKKPLPVGLPTEARPRSMAYTRPFFGEDRLVDMARFNKAFPGFDFTTVGQAQERLAAYYRYRFTDERFV